MLTGLEAKVAKAEDRLINIVEMQFPFHASVIYVAHSGGKDSVVVHHLAKNVFGDRVKVVHTPKITGFNAVHPDTIDFIYNLAAENGMEMVTGTNFREWLQQSGYRIQVDGTRRDEADRTDRSSNVIVDGKDVSRTEMTWFTENGLFGQTCVFPIYDWSDEDVWTYIRENQLAVSQEYHLSAAR